MKVFEIQKWNVILESMENRKYILFLEVRKNEDMEIQRVNEILESLQFRMIFNFRK